MQDLIKVWKVTKKHYKKKEGHHLKSTEWKKSFLQLLTIPHRDQYRTHIANNSMNTTRLQLTLLAACNTRASKWIDAGPELKYRPTGFLRSSPKAMLVNSQMVCLLPVRILTLILLPVLNICFNSCLIGLTNICTINTVKGNYNHHHHHFYWYTWLNYECNIIS